MIWEKTKGDIDCRGWETDWERCLWSVSDLSEINNELFNDYVLNMMVDTVWELTSEQIDTQKKDILYILNA